MGAIPRNQWADLVRMDCSDGLGLLKALNDRIVDAAQISADDLLITFIETAEENISFGRGLAQRADNSKM